MSLSCASQESTEASAPKTCLEALLHEMLDRLEARSTVWPQVVSAWATVAEMVAKMPGGAMTHWSLCSGAGFSSTALRTTLPVLAQRCRTDPVGFRECIAAEKNKKKQAVYFGQHKPEIMTDNMKELATHSDINLAQDGRRSSLPWSFLLDAGIPCVSRAGNNNNSEKNANCIQEFLAGTLKVTATGEGYSDIENVIKEHGPEVFSLSASANDGRRRKAPTRAMGSASSNVWRR